MDLAILADYRVKIKENEKRVKYLDLGRELKKLWNRKVTVIPTVTGVLRKIPKGLVKELEELEIKGQAENIHPLLRSARILRRVLETSCHLDSREKPSTNAGVKNSQIIVIWLYN